VFACLNLDDNAGEEPLSPEQARAELRELMEYASDELGRRASLTDALVAVEPLDPSRTVLAHAFSREFLLTPVDDRGARQYLCGQSVAQPAPPDYREVMFTFRQENGGTMGLLWGREGGRWRLVSYRLMTQ
jgi:hypothetical protein